MCVVECPDRCGIAACREETDNKGKTMVVGDRAIGIKTETSGKRQMRRRMNESMNEENG